MSPAAIRTEHLSKYYKLGVIDNGTFFRDMQSWIARKTGKPDPHAKISEDHFNENQEGFWALKDINVEIKEGDRVAIIGKNGAGKSTMLKILSRTTAPTEGTIKIKGKVASLLEVGTGFHGELTGRENIYLNGAILGMKKRRINQIINEIIAFSGIKEHIDTPVKRYSSGMYVRLAFAVAAYLDSDILIADEVLAVGDTEFQKKALGKMQGLSTEQGRTVLFVSHNIEAVKSLCNTGILLQQGRVIYQGNIDDAINAYSPKIEKDKITHWEGIDGDNDLKLYKAEIINEDENISIIITYEIFSPNKDYAFALLFFNKYDEQLCLSAISDYISNDNYKILCSAGVHTICLYVDTSMFLAGMYHIEFDFAIAYKKRITAPSTRLYFEVEKRPGLRHIRENNIGFSWKLEIEK